MSNEKVWKDVLWRAKNLIKSAESDEYIKSHVVYENSLSMLWADSRIKWLEEEVKSLESQLDSLHESIEELGNEVDSDE